MPDHPWFKGIVEHRWTREQIVLGEIQHYLRVRTNPIFFGYIVTNVASERNYALMDIVMENFMEELGGEKTHVDIMLQMLDEAGISREEADRADPAPGTTVSRGARRRPTSCTRSRTPGMVTARSRRSAATRPTTRRARDAVVPSISVST